MVAAGAGLNLRRSFRPRLQQSFEHSIWGPFGLKFRADEGRVALTRGVRDLTI